MKHSRFLIILILLISFALRVWKIETVPPSLYWDEMDAGYQAYSILKTGRDYFGNNPGLVVQSFADYRAPFQIYATVPAVAILGLNIYSVRLPAAIFGTLSIFLIYTLTKLLFKSEKISLLSALLTGLAPWSIQYGRMAFEGTFLLTLFLGGIIAFLKALVNPKWWNVSGLLFGLSLFAYNTAKLFTPITLLVLTLLYVRKKTLNKNFYLGAGIFIFLFAGGLFSSFFSGGGMRFSEIAVWTDPQLESSIDQYRQDSAASYSKTVETGMKTRLVDKVVFNKATFVLDKISRNYFESLSPDFLFITGDPNQRHSPYRMGEFYRVEFLMVILGILFLIMGTGKREKGKIFLLLWICLAPLPASVTREGGSHASRLFLMFPALSIASALGFFYIWGLVRGNIRKLALFLVTALWIFSVLFFINYYFGSYTVESAKFFQYGFPEAVKTALRHKKDYKYVIIDDRRDSALMNYLFETSYDPDTFQQVAKNLPFEFGKFQSEKLENIYFMRPGRRDWYAAFKDNLIDDGYLLIVSSEQLEEQTVEKLPGKLLKNQRLLEVIFYKNGDPAFYIIESNKPEAI